MQGLFWANSCDATSTRGLRSLLCSTLPARTRMHFAHWAHMHRLTPATVGTFTLYLPSCTFAEMRRALIDLPPEVDIGWRHVPEVQRLMQIPAVFTLEDRPYIDIPRHQSWHP